MGFHYKDKTVLRLSYRRGNPYTVKWHLYWDAPNLLISTNACLTIGDQAIWVYKTLIFVAFRNKRQPVNLYFDNALRFNSIFLLSILTIPNIHGHCIDVRRLVRLKNSKAIFVALCIARDHWIMTSLTLLNGSQRRRFFLSWKLDSLATRTLIQPLVVFTNKNDTDCSIIAGRSCSDKYKMISFIPGRSRYYSKISTV